MSEKIADEMHAFIAAAPHKYPGHLIELFDRAEKALRRCSAVSAAEGKRDAIVQLIHKHIGVRQRVNVDLTGVEDAADAILRNLNVPQTAPELTATCQKLLPGGIVDDATYAEIEDALDRAEAPSIVGGRWLKLHERIAALTAERTAASAEPQSQAEIAAIDLIAWLEADGMLSEHAKRLAPRFLSKFNVTRKSRAQAESVDGK